MAGLKGGAAIATAIVNAQEVVEVYGDATGKTKVRANAGAGNAVALCRGEIGDVVEYALFTPGEVQLVSVEADGADLVAMSPLQVAATGGSLEAAGAGAIVGVIAPAGERPAIVANGTTRKIAVLFT